LAAGLTAEPRQRLAGGAVRRIALQRSPVSRAGLIEAPAMFLDLAQAPVCRGVTR
jgi:hypothetical protein